MLYGLTHAQWAAQSGLSNGSIQDHAMKALADLGVTVRALPDMMADFLVNTKGLTGGSVDDLVQQWNGVFADALLLETGDGILLETGDALLKE